MITVNLLGGVKKGYGKSVEHFNLDAISIKELLDIIKSNAADASLLDINNLMIAINGADISLHSGLDTMISSGDLVTMVTIVHGG